MYASFFGLSKKPFSIAPDPRFLFMSEQHREALAHLLYGLGGGGGFVLLTGEIGAGKTTVCRCFLEQVPPNCAVAYVFNPKLTATELLQTVCGEFGLRPPMPAGSVKAHVDALNAFLLAAHAQGRQAVLVIDEAQSLSADVLEQLRLLTNLETAERKLLQIVLIGQPELRGMLARPELEQLAQRVIARFHLGALSFAETQQYIRHRLLVAGPGGKSVPLPFDSAALARIHALSGGVPRRINLLADRALLGAYAQGQSRADRRTVEQAAREVFASGPKKRRRSRRWELTAGIGMSMAALLLAGALAAALWARGRPDGPAPGQAARSPQSPPSTQAAQAAQSTQPTPRAAPSGSTPTSAMPAAGVPAAAVPAAPPAAPAAVADGLLADPAAVLAAAHPQQATAWRELALRWNVAIGEGDPCLAAAQAQLACFRSPAGGLTVLRQLARPVVVSLRPAGLVPGSGAVASGNAANGGVVYAVLVALDERQATLQVANRSFVLALPALASIWKGDFATFWRRPESWRDGGEAAADGALRGWIDTQLSAAGFPPPRPLPERIAGFQLAQGLPPDRMAGPMTLMLLNRVAGVDEPRLAGAR